MSREKLLRELKLKRVALGQATQKLGPLPCEACAMYEIASALNELVIIQLESQDTSSKVKSALEGALGLEGYQVTYIPTEGKVTKEGE